MASLSGKLVIVSGAGSGIGKAACEMFIRDGAKVIAADLDFGAAKETQKSLGENVYAIQVDVASSQSVADSLTEILTVFKTPPSILVNAAGIVGKHIIFELTEEEFDIVIDVNLKGTFLMMQNYGKAMKEYGLRDCSIINLSSVMGKTGSYGLASYSASKAGVEAMTKTASKELAQYGIRVNAIRPGFIHTPMTDPIPEYEKQSIIRSISLGRFGQPSEVAEVIVFLASDKSSSLNGTSIKCSGGAGGGIGRATCQTFIREGAKVVAADLNFEAAKETQKSLGENVYAIQMDVTSSRNIADSLTEIVTIFKMPPSILVNAAGIVNYHRLFEITEKEFDNVIGVNLKGTFLMMQHYGKAMMEYGLKDCSIINLASFIGKNGFQGLASYSASKAGVEAMTKTASKEFAQYGIRVNTVMPGFIETPMTAPVREDIRQSVIKSISLGRFGQPSEVAEVIVFLASDKSKYINGTSIECTGGM